ncbi:hypothetical protein ACTMSW_10660 [Micromonospora sp. BQ11]|uniref:hypothetical protein n=1 Tax=Micromonospora sp. BQ11 TaxID=3452212 RepID=UPI003F8A1234
MTTSKPLTRIPFYVEQASYCVGAHDAARCARCTDDGCPALDDARCILTTYREERAIRYGLQRAT